MYDIDELYREVLLDHNRRPRNFRKLEGADRTAEGFNPLCGDEVNLYLRVNDGVITDVGFEGRGCAISTASASMMTESIKGKTTEEADGIFGAFRRMITREPPEDDDDDREDLQTLATAITERVKIRLEHEAHYDWVAFVPQREGNAGALTKYFGTVAGDDDFKVRGIEARQRSTPPFIEDVQRDCLDRLDATRSPDAVLDCLQDAIKRLHAGTVSVEQLVERNRVSKPLEGYTQNTQNVAALKRAREQDLAVHPGQVIEYVVVDDEKSSRERVALAHEEIESYDASYYETQLVRAVESVLSPLGWDRSDIRRELSGERDAVLRSFGAIDELS
ncbi:MAG: SUF system NifU family Fe-S cluster assembly protein [Chloroflexi bacterium]|nr:SUF system NifU family Fe-S cluster assembly protein [Chloroflexota bacterium]